MPVVTVVVAVAVMVAVGVVTAVVGVLLTGVVVVVVGVLLAVAVGVGVSPIGVVAVRVGPWANSWAGAEGTTIRLITPRERGTTIITRLRMMSMSSRAVQRTGAPRV